MTHNRRRGVQRGHGPHTLELMYRKTIKAGEKPGGGDLPHVALLSQTGKTETLAEFILLSQIKSPLIQVGEGEREKGRERGVRGGSFPFSFRPDCSFKGVSLKANTLNS